MRDAPGRPVVFVIDNLEFGGGERGFLQLVGAFVEDGRRVTVACHPGGPFTERAAATGARLVALDMRRRAAARTVLALRRLVPPDGVTVVHSQGARADFLVRAALLGRGGARLVSTVQMPPAGFDVGPVRRRLYAALDRMLQHRVDRFIVVSRALRDALVRRGVPSARVRVIPNGVETGSGPAPPDGDAVAARLRGALAGAGERLIAAAGRLVWQKGFEHLIRAMPRILAGEPAARLVIAGRGPREAALRRAADACGVAARVSFLGFRADVPDLLRAVDVAVVPSLREGFPMITLEAMSAGAPVVATALPGIAEQIDDGVEGLLVPPADEPRLADAVLRVLRDPALRAALGAAGRRRVARCFTVERVVDATRRLYAELEASTP